MSICFAPCIVKIKLLTLVRMKYLINFPKLFWVIKSKFGHSDGEQYFHRLLNGKVYGVVVDPTKLHL